MNMFISKWNNYTEDFEELENIIKKLNIFPNRQSLLDQKKKLENNILFNYEAFINRNNSLNALVLRMTVRDWFECNCQHIGINTIDEFLDQINFEEIQTVMSAVEDIVQPFSEQFCCKFCEKQSINDCFQPLISEIIKISERHMIVLNTAENLNLLLTGGTQFVQKELSQKNLTSSPIEVIMSEALLPIANKYGLTVKREYPIRDDGRTEIRYSLDIVLLDKYENIVLDVETDGLNFHSGYRNMNLDRARDRWLLIRGVPTMRFTSQDIFNNLNKSVIQVDECLKTLREWKKF